MMKRYGLGWLDLEVALAADLAFSAFKIIRDEKEEENDKFLFGVWHTEKLMYTIRSFMAKDPPDFVTFSEFKAPKKKNNSFTEEEKEKLREESRRIREKLGGAS